MNFDSVSMRYGFLRDACAVLISNAAELLTLADQPVTQESILAVVKSMPTSVEQLRCPIWRQQPCSKALESATRKTHDTNDRGRYLRLCEYFLEYIPSRSYVGLDLLQAAFCGVLSFDFDPPKGLAKYKKQGPLRRWAARRGL